MQAKAWDSLSLFYEACAQIEVDEYRDYHKALQVRLVQQLDFLSLRPTEVVTLAACGGIPSPAWQYHWIGHSYGCWLDIN